MSYGNASYVYSENGDLGLKIEGTDTTRYVYDAFGSLVSVTLPNGTLIQYMLDGNGLRVGRKVNGAITNKWIYSNNLRIVAESDSTNNVTSRFVYTTSKNVPEYMLKGGIVYRVVTDHLGNVNHVVSTQSGAIVERIEYDEYGNVLTDSNPGFVPFGFAGGSYDSMLRAVRFGKREGTWMHYRIDPDLPAWAVSSILQILQQLGDLERFAADRARLQNMTNRPGEQSCA